MAKKSVDTEKAAKPQDKFKVEFLVKFKGAFNDRYFENARGDVIEVNAAQLAWLDAKGVIRG